MDRFEGDGLATSRGTVRREDLAGDKGGNDRGKIHEIQAA